MRASIPGDSCSHTATRSRSSSMSPSTRCHKASGSKPALLRSVNVKCRFKAGTIVPLFISEAPGFCLACCGSTILTSASPRLSTQNNRLESPFNAMLKLSYFCKLCGEMLISQENIQRRGGAFAGNCLVVAFPENRMQLLLSSPISHSGPYVRPSGLIQYLTPILQKGGSNSVVECQLPKLDVAGSIPVSRSK